MFWDNQNVIRTDILFYQSCTRCNGEWLGMLLKMALTNQKLVNFEIRKSLPKGWANFHIYYLTENGFNTRQVNPDLNVSEQRDIHDNFA